MKIFLICCEKSSNNIIDQILSKIKHSVIDKNISIAGIVYNEVATKYNIEQFFNPEELAIIGIGDIIFSISEIIEKIENTANKIVEFQPDLVISVDAYDFCIHVIKTVRKIEKKNFDKNQNVKNMQSSKTIQAWHIVAPSVWAYWSFRAKILAKYYDRLFYLLPFEFNYFKQLERIGNKNNHGFLSTFIGYPATFQTRDSSIKKDNNLIGIMIGSRKNEINRHKDLIISTIIGLKMINKNFKFAIFTTEDTASFIKQLFSNIKNIEFFDKNSDKLNMIQKCILVVAKNGTNNVEIGALGTSMVVYYKTSILTYFFGKIFIKKIRFINLFNIVLNKQVVPEFIQKNATANNLIHAIIQLLNNDNLRNEQIEQIDKAISLMQRKDKKHPSDVVCEEIINFFSDKNKN